MGGAIVDLIIWGLFYLFTPPSNKHETDNSTFIILDNNGNLQNMWEADKPVDSDNDSIESNTSGFEI